MGILFKLTFTLTLLFGLYISLEQYLGLRELYRFCELGTKKVALDPNSIPEFFPRLRNGVTVEELSLDGKHNVETHLVSIKYIDLGINHYKITAGCGYQNQSMARVVTSRWCGSFTVLCFLAGIPKGTGMAGE